MSENLFALGANVEVQKATDNLGGKYTLDGGLYDFKIKMAFLDKAKSGAQYLKVSLLRKGEEYTNDFDIYFTSKAAPDKVTVEKNGKTFPTYGYNKINDLCLRAVGKPLAAMEIVEKQVEVWKDGAKVIEARPALSDLIGEFIACGIKEIREDNYKNTPQETLPPTIKNELDKFFDSETYQTTAEITAGATEAKFATVWKTKWEGQIEDKTTKVGPSAATAGAPAAAGDAKAPSIFK
jgi:hypothetical protein